MPDALDQIGPGANGVARQAQELPLSHSVPSTRVSQWNATSCECLIAKDHEDGSGKRVCFYLGPAREWGRHRDRDPAKQPVKFPVVVLHAAPCVEGDDWWAYPCDAGGVAREQRRVRDELRMLGRFESVSRWRPYVQRFVETAYAGNWEDYVAARPPNMTLLPPGLRLVLGEPQDSPGWTPEVCSPKDVAVDKGFEAAGVVASVWNTVDPEDQWKVIGDTLRILRTRLGPSRVETLSPPEWDGPAAKVAIWWSERRVGEGLLRA